MSYCSSTSSWKPWRLVRHDLIFVVSFLLTLLFEGTLMETETTTWSEFSSGRKATVEQILGSEERYKYKREGL